MATIVNARDVLLQAAGTRVAGVQLSTNLSLSQDQVTGLGLALEGIKQLFITASSQVFQIPKSGSTSPSSITLTATVRNFSATPSFSVIAGTLTGNPPEGTTGTTYTITPALMSTDTVTLKIQATDPSTSTVYSDTITLVKVREGIDSLTGFLTNENHTLPADSAGNVTSYAGCGGTFKVFQGTTDITTLCSFSLVSNPNGLTQSINASSGVYSITAGMPAGVDVTTITYRATFGSSTIDKAMTIAKSKAGAAGSSGAAGQRGSRTYYVALSGSTNTWSDSLATTTVTADGGPVVRDVVTQYNNSQNFSQSKYWDGSVWQLINAVVDGNLLVSGTVAAAAMQAGLFQGDNVLTRGLTVRDNSGNVILAAGSNLDFSRVGGATKPENNATNGATIGTNLSGTFTTGNIGVYMPTAVIGSAQVTTINANQVNAANLSAITATIGTLRTATSGARTEIQDNLITVYDSSNVVRVKIGVF